MNDETRGLYINLALMIITLILLVGLINFYIGYTIEKNKDLYQNITAINETMPDYITITTTTNTPTNNTTIIKNDTLPPLPVETSRANNPDQWQCMDYARNYSENNPVWGIVVVSDNKKFLGICHFLNYKILDTGELILHDEKLNHNVTVEGWEYDRAVLDYYYFWPEDRPLQKYWYTLHPNAEEKYESIFGDNRNGTNTPI